MASRDEQETTVTSGRDEEWVRIWTNNPVHARKLDADARAIKETTNAEGEWGGSYRVKTTDFDPLKGFRRKTRPMTEEQRQAAVERLANARNKENNA